MNGKLMLLSLLSMLNVIFLPIYDVWGGLFPEDPDYNFLDVIQLLISDSDALGYWVVEFSLLLFIAGFLTFLFAISEGQIMQRVVPLLGILAVTFTLLRNGNQNGWDSVIGEDSNVCIGVWTGLLLMIISLAVTFIPVHERSWNPPSLMAWPHANSVQQPEFQAPVEPFSSEMELEKNFCPNCGQKIMKPSKFCGKCGFHLE